MTGDAQGHYAVHNDAGFILVSGIDAVDFLQSLLTANIETLAVGACRPAALLTPQGRVLIDMMIYRQTDTHIYLQTDIARRDDLFARLRRYRLRRPVDLAVAPYISLTLWWGFAENNILSDITLGGSGIFRDPRHACLGYRILASGGSLPSAMDGAHPAPIDAWHARRIAAAIPEGPHDLVPERALMLEAGLDKLGAVDFGKGCYIGQEVTARTFYRGLMKRRLVPIHIAGAPPAPGSDILWQDKIVGSSKTAAPHPDDPQRSVTLGLLKLDDIEAIVAADPHDGAASKPDAAESYGDDLRINDWAATIVLPAWMLPLPKPQKP